MKQQAKESVIHDWVSELPFTQQAVLMVAMRGPDGLSKDNLAKPIVFYMRHAVMKPAYPYKDNEPYKPGNFMCCDFDNFSYNANALLENHDDMPHHFLMHIIHAAEIIGYKHPDPIIRGWFNLLYRRFCESFHMHPESFASLDKRLEM